MQGFFLRSMEKHSPDQRPTFASSCFTCQFTLKTFPSDVYFPFQCEPCNTQDMHVFLDSVREHTNPLLLLDLDAEFCTDLVTGS